MHGWAKWPGEKLKSKLLSGTDGGSLLEWYDANGRDLPWRRTKEPYPVWVSEVMLQQTQVATALPYYERWMARFPTVEALAMASLEEALSKWQGLGYYRRCKLLHKGAQAVVASGWPASYREWLAVPGVGPYTAAALSSICLGLPTAVVDGNVERVYARVCADPALDPHLLKHAQQWATQQMFAPRPGDWNQAVMELGATICTPRHPKCTICPIEEDCIARQTWQVENFPAANPKPEVRHLQWQVAVPFRNGKFGLEKVPAGEWWEDLWRFPTTHDDGQTDPWAEVAGHVRHTVTHHRITMLVVLQRPDEPGHLSWHTLEELETIPIPAPYRKALALVRNLLGL
jgi:A/G-specific adenine glycosylase